MKGVVHPPPSDNIPRRHDASAHPHTPCCVQALRAKVAKQGEREKEDFLHEYDVRLERLTQQACTDR